MVYDPSRPKGPATVPNSYILTSAKDDGFADMVRAVDALIKSEGRENDVQWTSQLTFIGVGVIKCDDAFAAKLKTLPSVGSVEKENFVYPAKKKPGGPRL